MRPACAAAGRVALAASALLALSACGQKGPLYLPTEPASAQRATLLQTLRPGRSLEPTPGTSTMPAPAASSPRNTP
ncbi:MAG: hypothetical protein EPN79_06105 [Burkholderiaceae bacterium]|nr:MAG: hypothetical protein EPN79_06105 [Burkholderiaceae bacterium]TBR75764.1 MAG: hypothetical protein EPN64_11305 [Burkholderiaceae bacterium]